MVEVLCNVHMIFIPDETGYEELKQDSSRRAEILLETMDELLLKSGVEPQFPGKFNDVAIKTVDGRFDEDALDEKLRPLVLEYNGLWNIWQIEQQGRAPSDVGDIQMVSVGLQENIYYYADVEAGEFWCRRGFAMELVEPSGNVIPFRISRPIDPGKPNGEVFYSDVTLTLTHVPLQP